MGGTERGRERGAPALGSGEEGYRWLVENTTETVWRFDLEEPVPDHLPEDEQIARFFRDGYLAECNDAMARLYGHAAAADILGTRLEALLDPRDPRNHDYLRAFIRSGYHLLDAESAEVDRDGRPKYVLNNLVGIRRDGRVLGAWGTSRDITDRRRAEEEVRRSRDLLEVILEGVDEAVTAQDRDGRLVFANAAAARSLRFPSAQALLASPPGDYLGAFELRDTEDRPLAVADLPGRRALADGLPHRLEIRSRLRGSGEEGWWVAKAIPVAGGEGGPSMVINFFQDVTEAKRAEESLRRSREQLSVILANVADAIVVHDGDGGMVYANDAAARLMGLASPSALLEAARRPGAEAEERRLEVRDEAGKPVPLEEIPYRRALKGEDVGPTRQRFRQPAGGSERQVVVQSRPVKDDEGRIRMVITILQDVTELGKAEEQFRQSQKMEAIGRLAGGVAHDFNNLLTAINGYSDLLLGLMDAEDARRQHVEEIRRAGERAAGLTHQLLAYSRKQMLNPRLLRPGEVLAGLEPMLRRIIGEDIRLAVSADADTRSIRADRGQVEQILVNLAVNARDAMPEGGDLVLRSANARFRPGEALPDPALPPGDYVVLSVADTGVGMGEDVKARLFEPFFTTKPVGKGTGLGLSTAYGIAKQSGGTITAASEPGRGAEFRVFFPAAQDDADAQPEPGRAAEGRTPGGRETVLVVEDEEGVRRLVAGILAGLGYEVIEAVDGVDAIDVAGRHAGPLDLLLTDVVMSRMGGSELARRLRETRPGIRCLFMTGYTDDPRARDGAADAHGEVYLQKPFSPSALARGVREALDASAPASPSSR